MQLMLDGQVLNPTVPDFGCTLCTINQSIGIAELSEAERTIIEDMIAEGAKTVHGDSVLV